MCHGNSSHSHSGNSADFRVVIHMSSFLLHTSDFYDGCNYSFHYGNRKNVKWLYSSLLVFVIEGEKKNHLFCSGGNQLRRVELGRADWVSGR